jgi:hypothetical protein
VDNPPVLSARVKRAARASRLMDRGDVEENDDSGRKDDDDFLNLGKKRKREERQD